MLTPIHDIYVEQGAPIAMEFFYEDANENGISVTGADGYTHGHMQVRYSTEAISTEVVLEVNDTEASVLGITGYSGEFVLNHGGVSGCIKLDVSAETMAAVPAGKYFYEIRLVNPVMPLKLLRGRFVVEPGALR
jgi:hypothetical protein